MVPQLCLCQFWHFCSCPTPFGLCGCFSLFEDSPCHPLARCGLSQTKQAAFALICLGGDAAQATGESLWTPPRARRLLFCSNRGTASSWDFTSTESLYKGFFTRLASRSPHVTFSPFGMQKQALIYMSSPVLPGSSNINPPPCCCRALFKSRGLHMGEDVLKKDQDVTLSQLLWFGNI